jgi:pheromone alpha factor receptor
MTETFIFPNSNLSLFSNPIVVETMKGTAYIPLRTLDHIQFDKMFLVALFAVRIATTFVVIIWYFFAVNKTKRSKFLYIVNQLSLLFIFIQSILFLIYVFSNFCKMSTILTSSYAEITQNDINVSCAASVFQFLFIACLELALFIQATVVFQKSVKWLKYLVTLIQGFVALTTTALYMAIIAQAIHSTLNPYHGNLFKGRFGYLVPSLGQIFFSISVTSCMIIFVGKLVFAIHQRRTLGIKQFDGLQILVIMSTQSMIIPTILVLLSFSHYSATRVYTMAPFIVVLSLPLSSLWAEAKTTRDSASYAEYSGSSRGRSLFASFTDRLACGSSRNDRHDHESRGNGSMNPRKTDAESTIEMSSCYTDSPTYSKFDVGMDAHGFVFYNEHGLPVVSGGIGGGSSSNRVKLASGHKYEVNTMVVLSDIDSPSPTDVIRK